MFAHSFAFFVEPFYPFGVSLPLLGRKKSLLVHRQAADCAPRQMHQGVSDGIETA